MRRTILLTVVAVLWLVAMTAVPASAGVPDQSQTSFGAPYYWGIGNCGGNSIAQSFTSRMTGSLDQVDVGILRDSRNTSGPLDIEIRALSGGLPTGEVLAMATVPLSGVPESPPGSFLPVPLDPPASVYEGVEYAIVVLPTYLDCWAGYWWTYVDGDPYTSGNGFGQVDGGPWQAMNPGEDFTFVTYVDPIAPSDPLVITSDTTLTEDHTGTILIDADNVTLDCAGHTVFGPGLSGFNGGINVADGRTGVTVRNCTVTGFDVNGIFAGGTSAGTYENNVLYGNANHGIHIDFGSGHVVAGNTSEGNGAIGIVVTNVTQSRIADNTVHDHANWAGIALFDGSNSNLVSGNTVSGGVAGFEVIRSTDNAFTDNSADGNQTGWYLSEASGSVMTGNEAMGNVGDGFVVEESAGTMFSDDVASDNDGSGFSVIASPEALLLDNLAARNGGAGFALDREDRSLLESNVARENGGDGFVIFAGSGNELRANLSTGNGSYGIALGSEATANLVTGNRAVGNGYENIALVYGASHNKVIGNIARASEFEGISLFWADDNVVRDNVLIGNGSSGILLYDSSRNVVTGNWATLNSLFSDWAGISVVEGSSFNRILRNAACGNQLVDAWDDHSGTGNAWGGNRFCTSDI